MVNSHLNLQLAGGAESLEGASSRRCGFTKLLSRFDTRSGVTGTSSFPPDLRCDLRTSDAGGVSTTGRGRDLRLFWKCLFGPGTRLPWARARPPVITMRGEKEIYHLLFISKCIFFKNVCVSIVNIKILTWVFFLLASL